MLLCCGFMEQTLPAFRRDQQIKLPHVTTTRALIDPTSSRRPSSARWLPPCSAAQVMWLRLSSVIWHWLQKPTSPRTVSTFYPLPSTLYPIPHTPFSSAGTWPVCVSSLLLCSGHATYGMCRRTVEVIGPAVAPPYPSWPLACPPINSHASLIDVSIDHWYIGVPSQPQDRLFHAPIRTPPLVVYPTSPSFLNPTSTVSPHHLGVLATNKLRRHTHATRAPLPVANLQSLSGLYPVGVAATLLTSGYLRASSRC